MVAHKIKYGGKSNLSKFLRGRNIQANTLCNVNNNRSYIINFIIIYA